MYIQPITEGNYYHIYNRGINGEDIFKSQENYPFFLKQYQLYCSDVLDTYAYSLLKNHFHLLVYVKEDVWVPKNNTKGMIRLNASKQLSHFFNSYAQSINWSVGRTGGLFESPFERKHVDDERYLDSMINYCHFNACKHGFVKDFRDWEYSSYHSILNKNDGIVAVSKVLELFGGDVSLFEKLHLERQMLNLDRYGIEK
jgi:putative transposase